MKASGGLSQRSILRRYLLLTASRWLAVGFVIPVQVLLPLSRGLSLAEVGVVIAVQGFVVLALELPTGGLTDSWGRRPVALLAAVIGCAGTAIFLFAPNFATFAAAFAVLGVFRALDSGPVESWFVDANAVAVPGNDPAHGLSAGNTALGAAIALGAALTGGLVLWDPLPSVGALVTPVIVALAVQLVTVVGTAVMMTELPRHVTGAVGGMRGVPAVIGSGVRLLVGSRVLLALVAVELLWGFGMPAFESITPVKLAAQLDNADAAAALLGPMNAVGWGLYAVGAWLSGPLMRWLGAAGGAIVLRLVQGATVIGMGVVAGPVGLVTAFLGCYLVHGPSNALHSTLLHRSVGADRRATVVSLNSMVSQGAGAIGYLVLTAVADGASVDTAFVMAGIVLAAAAPLYLPAWRAERRAPSPAVVEGPAAVEQR